jgi:hypothetical protein
MLAQVSLIPPEDWDGFPPIKVDGGCGISALINA